MATLISSQFSANKMLNWSRRHIRLCKFIDGADSLTNQINPVMAGVLAKQEVVNQKQVMYEDAMDDRTLADIILDDTICTIYESCNQYERLHSSEIIL